MHQISIVGSCVTRDLFTHVPEALLSVTLGAYISRATTLSMVAKAPAAVNRLLSADEARTFDDRRFHQDVRKSYFKALSAAKPDFVIVDLIDERHATLELPDASRVTLTKVSQQFLDKHKLRRQGRSLVPLSDEWLAQQRESWPEFARRIHESAPEARVLVHHAPYARLYREEDRDHSFPQQEQIARWNVFLDEAYATMTRLLGAKPLVVGEPFIRAGGNHLWDLNPFHYDRAYYVDLWKTLQAQMV